jgi:hypothetical protein
VTVCNWNSQFGDCSYCGIKLLTCNTVNDTGYLFDCLSLWQPVDIIVNISANGYFRCYQFSTNASSPLTTSLTDYTGSYNLIFGVNATATNDLSVRYGLQTTFGVVGSTPDVFNETNFARIGEITYYSLINVTTTNIAGDSTSRFDRVPSAISLPNEQSEGEHKLTTLII